VASQVQVHADLETVEEERSQIVVQASGFAVALALGSW
jgi:hypothetical protein